MAINLNVSPYYDDFDANKKFNRVVFKPGVAVQARELTQMQDYFYETIKDFADYVFVDGACVRGCEADPLLVDLIKINDTDASGNTVSNDSLSNFVGDTLTGGLTGQKAVIYDTAAGSQTELVTKKTIYLQYTSGNTQGAGDGINKRFDAGETLTVTSDNADRNGKTFVVNSDVNLSSRNGNFYGQAIDFSIAEGVLYAQGRFVKHATQKIRLDPYSAKVNYFIGIILQEEIITSDDDLTLLDPATGAYNYNAPGADRTKITTKIAKVPYGDEYESNRQYELGEFVAYQNNIYEVTVGGTSAASGGEPVHTSGTVASGGVEFTYAPFPDNFTAIYKVKNGALQPKINQELDELSNLGATLARRTSEESGDYVISPFTLEILEHLKTVKGVDFNTSTNTSYSLGQYVNHNGNLYEVLNTLGTAEATNPPIHTSGNAVSGTVTFGYRGDSYRIDNQGYHLETDENDPGDPNYIVAKVSSGIAYVNGYRRDFNSPTYLKIRKGIDTEIKESLDVNLSYGNYFDCNYVIGEWDLEEGSLVEIGYDTGVSTDPDGKVGLQVQAGASTASGPQNHTGTCRVRAIKLMAGEPGVSNSTNVWRVFVYDVKVRNGDLKDARTLYWSDGSGSQGFADIILEPYTDESGNDISFAKLKGQGLNRMVFPCSWRSTKTLYAAGGGSLDTAYYYTEEFEVTPNASGEFTLDCSTLGSEVQFPYSASMTQLQLDQNFMVVNKTGATVTNTSLSQTYADGEIIRLTPSMVTSFSSQEMDFTIGNLTSTGTMTFYVQVMLKVVDAPPVSKNYNINRYVKIRTNDNAGGSTGPWCLGIADVKEIEAIYITDSDSNVYLDDADEPTNYKDDFILDNGQRDGYYGHAQLFKRGGNSVDMVDKHVTVKLSHFEPDYASSNGTYFAADSYPVDDTGSTGIYTFEIPYYRSRFLGTMDLRDCIDFRPYVSNTAFSAPALANATQNPYRTDDLNLPPGGVQYPIPSTTFTTDVEYYLPRTDRIYISLTGGMRVVEGISEIPSRPPVLKPGMQIAEIRVPPYPSVSRAVAKKFNVIEKAVGHMIKGQIKRYTMKDIGQIEKRIDRLEYYLALSLMEMAAKDKVILDANGNDRFKNGIYVNPFDSDLLSDLADPAYNAAYDSTHKLCQPNYEEDDINLIHNPTHGTGWEFMGKHITRTTGDEVPFLENQFPTKTRNCVGELLFNYTGKMDLFPRSDNFASTSAMEPMNLHSSNQAAVQAAAASITASKNVVGSSTSFEMGGISAGGGFTAGGSNSSTETINFDGGSLGPGSYSNTTTETIPGGMPESMTTPDPRNGWWELVEEGTRTTTETGEYVISGSYDQTTTTQSIQQTTTDYLLTASAGSAGQLNFNLGGVVRDVSLLPYMRPKNIAVRVSMMKPNTRLYCYFDNENVTEFCTPLRVDTVFDTTDGQDDFTIPEGSVTPLPRIIHCGFDRMIEEYGKLARPTGEVFEACIFEVDDPLGRNEAIITDAEGNAAFTLHLPGDRFPVGTRRIWVVDDPTNRENFITTFAENQFSSFGLHTTTQEISLTADLYQLEYGTTVGGSSSSIVGTVVTDVTNSNAAINVGIENVETTVDETQPKYVYHPPLQFGDPIAQTFNTERSPTPVFLSSVKVWFRTKPGERDGVSYPATLPATTGTGSSITMSIRKCLNGFPTREVIGRCTLPAGAVKTTPDISGGNATNFDFQDQYSTTFHFGNGPDILSVPLNLRIGVGGLAQAKNNAPVVLDPTEEYAFVLEPSQNDPNYEVWCSKLGEVRIGTESQRVTADNSYGDGVLFTSSNNRTWTPHQTEDMKFVLNLHSFPTGSGTVEYVNDHEEFVTGYDFQGGKPEITEGGKWYSFKTTISDGGSGYNIGDTIVLDTTRNNCPKGIILEVTTTGAGGAVTAVKPIQWHDGSEASYNAHPYTIGNVVTFNRDFVDITTGDSSFSQASTSGSGADFTCTLKLKTMNMKKVDNQLNRYDFVLPHISPDFNSYDVLNGDTSLLPQAGDLWWKHQIGKKTMRIQQAGLKKIFNISKTNMTVKEYENTNIDIQRATTRSSGVTVAGTSFESLTPSLFRNTANEMAIYSLSDELDNLSATNYWGSKSYKHRVTLTNTNIAVSPIINPERLSATTREYIVNDDYTDETLAKSGNARSKFISKIVKLADGQEAEDMRLSVAQFTPGGSSVKVYFRGMSGEDDLDLRRDIAWTEMEYADSNPNGSANTAQNFTDLDYKLPASDGTTYGLNSDGRWRYETSRIAETTISLGGNAGSGYPSLTDAPVFITGGGADGGNAQAVAAVRDPSTGGITSIRITEPGSGFTSAPTIKIGEEHAHTTTYGTNKVVASGGKIFRTTAGGTTAAASAGTSPSELYDAYLLANPTPNPPAGGTVVGTDGSCVWTYLGVQATATCTINTVERTGFKYFQCKIVMCTPNTSIIPSIKQLRMIALMSGVT